MGKPSFRSSDVLRGPARQHPLGKIWGGVGDWAIGRRVAGLGWRLIGIAKASDDGSKSLAPFFVDEHPAPAASYAS